MKYTMVDLFSGIGGIRLGFEYTGRFTCLMSCEIDEKAADTYCLNFTGSPRPFPDVTKLSAANIPSFDVLAAGFPCQAFSAAGARGGFEDTRGTLFFDVVRIIKYHRPKAVFLENVKGLLSHDKGKTFQTIVGVLEDLGYHVHSKVLRATDYGVPQKRDRVYIVAINASYLGLPPMPEFVLNGCEPLFKFPAGQETVRRIKDVLEHNVPAKSYVSAKYFAGLKRHRENQQAAGRGFGYEIVKCDGFANTLVCGGMGRERNIVIDHNVPTPYPSEKNAEHARFLTPREWARLQGFPDCFVIPDRSSLAYKQLGNSVAVPVVTQIADEITKTLDRLFGGNKVDKLEIGDRICIVPLKLVGTVVGFRGSAVKIVSDEGGSSECSRMDCIVKSSTKPSPVVKVLATALAFSESRSDAQILDRMAEAREKAELSGMLDEAILDIAKFKNMEENNHWQRIAIRADLSRRHEEKERLATIKEIEEDEAGEIMGLLSNAGDAMDAFDHAPAP